MSTTTTDPHAVDFKAWAHRVATSQARAYHLLLGEGWTLDGYRVTKGEVTVNAMSGTISWLDLAPVGETRQRQSIRLSGGQSHGATVALAQALAEMKDAPVQCENKACGSDATQDVNGDVFCDEHAAMVRETADLQRAEAERLTADVDIDEIEAIGEG